MASFSQCCDWFQQVQSAQMPEQTATTRSPLTQTVTFKVVLFSFLFQFFQEDAIFKADSADSDCKWMQALWKAELDRRAVENGDFHRGLDNPVHRKRKSKGYRG